MNKNDEMNVALLQEGMNKNDEMNASLLQEEVNKNDGMNVSLLQEEKETKTSDIFEKLDISHSDDVKSSIRVDMIEKLPDNDASKHIRQKLPNIIKGMKDLSNIVSQSKKLVNKMPKQAQNLGQAVANCMENSIYDVHDSFNGVIGLTGILGNLPNMPADVANNINQYAELTKQSLKNIVKRNALNIAESSQACIDEWSKNPKLQDDECKAIIADLNEKNKAITMYANDPKQIVKTSAEIIQKHDELIAASRTRNVDEEVIQGMEQSKGFFYYLKKLGKVVLILFAIIGFIIGIVVVIGYIAAKGGR